MSNKLKIVWGLRKDAGLVVLSLLATVSLAGAIMLGLQDRTGSGALLAGLGLLLLAFVQLSRFKRFKGMGFEAELWESKQEEAEDLINRTRALLAILSGAILRSAPRMGRMMLGFDRRELLDLVESVEAALARAGVDRAEIAPMRSEVDRLVAWDLARPITQSISKAVQDRLAEMRKEVAERYGSPIVDNAGHSRDMQVIFDFQRERLDPNTLADLPRTEWPNALRRRMDALVELSDEKRAELQAENEEALLDLEAWVTRTEVRRPQVFYDPRALD